jgi:hypothetical protein
MASHKNVDHWKLPLDLKGIQIKIFKKTDEKCEQLYKTCR